MKNNTLQDFISEDSIKNTNKLGKLYAEFAILDTDLIEALERVGSSAQDAGVSFEQLIALITLIQQKTARGGSVIGNSLKSIFTKIQRKDYNFGTYNTTIINCVIKDFLSQNSIYRSVLDILKEK